MKGFNYEFIDELKNKNDIVDVASKYVVLEQRGTNFWGRCPFHHEKTASFCINSSGQFYYCFGCHKSGDVISLVRELEALDFNDAVKFLAERAHLPLPEIQYDDEKAKAQKKEKERLLSLLKDTALFYVKNLRTAGAVKHHDYAVKRGLSTETLTKFGIGASLDFNTLPKFLEEKGYTKEEMVLSGAVDVKDGRYYDALGGRLIVPIIDAFNQVIAFGGRLLEKADFAKYKNTKETKVFSKSNVLYNINNLKKIKNERGLNSVIIVEGYMDTISLVAAGIENVVASMGTSLTKDQARILKRYTDKVYISYDGDFAGQKAAIRGLEILKDEGLEVKVVALPDGKDPDDVVREGGKQAYDKLLADAKPLVDFKIDILRRTYDVKKIDEKRKFVASAIKVIRESESAVEQEDLLKTVRDLTGVTLEALKRDLYSEEPINITPTVHQLETPVESEGSKSVKAARFVLAAYLFGWKFASDYDISEIEFPLGVHNEIKSYILEKRKEGKEIRFSDLYELFEDEYEEELSALAKLDTAENKDFDKQRYFEDCEKALLKEKTESEIHRITEMIKSETDAEARKKLTLELSTLLIKLNKYSR